jgi:GT2 family glycosyltransferase
VIYNGVDHYGQAEASLREATRAKLGVGPGEVMLLYVGRLNPEAQPYKGTLDLIHNGMQWRKLDPRIRLVMAGLGNETDARTIRESGAVPLLDVPAERMPALYSAADIYVTASRWEGFDLPLMEAAYAGVPSVALHLGAHPEVVKHGETGLLVSDTQEFAEAACGLAQDAGTRRAMGEAARTHATKFTWARAADEYEGVVHSLVAQTTRTRSASRVAVGAAIESVGPGPATTPAISMPDRALTSDVTAVILNYGASYEVLSQCVSSLLSQTHPVNALVVDNASRRNQEALESLASEFSSVQILRLDRNYGFAGGMNRGIAAASTELVLLLNNDVVLEPEAVEEMRRAIDVDENVIGVAPKIMLQQHPSYIDAIGNAIDGQGSAFNVGIGQLDIGQYDRTERAFGACFAATLLRRKAFDPGLVGPLEERFFMYYEDVDWCFRANALGLKFVTAPKAVVYHAHSLSTRELDYAFKYRLIMRNFMWTAARDFERRRAWRVVARRTLGQIRSLIRGPHRRASAMILVQGWLGLPGFWRQRRIVEGRRRVNDEEIFNYSHGERPFFDPVSYSPIRRLEALAFAYHRLFLIRGEERHRRIAEAASALASSRLRFDRELVRERLRPLIADEPPQVLEFLESLEA